MQLGTGTEPTLSFGPPYAQNGANGEVLFRTPRNARPVDHIPARPASGAYRRDRFAPANSESPNYEKACYGFAPRLARRVGTALGLADGWRCTYLPSASRCSATRSAGFPSGTSSEPEYVIEELLSCRFSNLGESRNQLGKLVSRLVTLVAKYERAIFVPTGAVPRKLASI